MTEVMGGKEKLEIVPELCYLGDMLSNGGGCQVVVVTCCKCALDKFRQLLSFLNNHNLSILSRGRVYSTNVSNIIQ